MNIINLTPHALNIKTATGDIIEVAPSGIVARVSENREALPALNGIGVTRATYGDVENLPPVAPGTVYVVSALVLARVTGRSDVFAPGPAIRDDAGRIIGCDGLSAAPDSDKITVSVDDVWAIESEATLSYGYGGRLTQAVAAILRGETISDSLAHAIVAHQERITPHPIDGLPSDPRVTITQTRDVFNGKLLVKATFTGTGKERELKFNVYKSGEADAQQKICQDINAMLEVLTT